MGIRSRERDIVGSAQPLTTIASATRLFVPDTITVFYVSGSTTIATIQTDKVRPGRELKILWASGATAGVTDTAIGTTLLAPQTTTNNICLSGAISPAHGTVLTVIQDAYGQWLETARSING